MNENKQTSWQDRLKEIFKYDKDCSPNLTRLIKYSDIEHLISQLLKDQRESVVHNILIGFGVGTIEDYQIDIIKNNGLKASEPTLEGDIK
jgi:hypothetical protein